MCRLPTKGCREKGFLELWLEKVVLRPSKSLLCLPWILSDLPPTPCLGMLVSKGNTYLDFLLASLSPSWKAKGTQIVSRPVAKALSLSSKPVWILSTFSKCMSVRHPLYTVHSRPSESWFLIQGRMFLPLWGGRSPWKRDTGMEYRSLLCSRWPVSEIHVL